MLETLSTQNTGKRERWLSERISDGEQDTGVEDNPVLGFMQSKIGGLASSKPRLMGQVDQSSAPIRKAKTQKLCFIIKPRGETPSSAVIDYEFEDSEALMKPNPEEIMTQKSVKADLLTEQKHIPDIKTVESSPSRTLMMARGKSRTLEPSGRLLLKSVVYGGTEPLKRVVELKPGFLKGKDLESSNSCLQEHSHVTNRSQRSILKQSSTKQGNSRRNQNHHTKDNEDPKDSKQDSSIGEFLPLASIKRVSFSKTNMLFLYSVNKSNAPIVGD